MNELNQKLTKDSYIIKLDGIYKIFWDVLCMIIIFYEMIIIPLRISFENGNEENTPLFVFF
jgi:hypothetical protein